MAVLDPMACVNIWYKCSLQSCSRLLSVITYKYQYRLHSLLGNFIFQWSPQSIFLTPQQTRRPSLTAPLGPYFFPITVVNDKFSDPYSYLAYQCTKSLRHRPLFLMFKWSQWPIGALIGKKGEIKRTLQLNLISNKVHSRDHLHKMT